MNISSKAKLILIIVSIVLVILALIGFGLWYLFKSENMPDQTPASKNFDQSKATINIDAINEKYGSKTAN